MDSFDSHQPRECRASNARNVSTTTCSSSRRYCLSASAVGRTSPSSDWRVDRRNRIVSLMALHDPAAVHVRLRHAVHAWPCQLRYCLVRLRGVVRRLSQPCARKMGHVRIREEVIRQTRSGRRGRIIPRAYACGGDASPISSAGWDFPAKDQLDDSAALGKGSRADRSGCPGDQLGTLVAGEPARKADGRLPRDPLRGPAATTRPALTFSIAQR